ncbi:hypothetical protein O181_111468 [Austropuccinia psidii MF-1]|uniref:Ty3 transposon capsid-like protein domain-containing protein n=1 Tax=Austropuccinia psidii MF-1 TaxID=1389203 RepID=A0A9Q3JZK3_9BASI|nr:hypothetical protein [Austropuccinia psidii MF-1]
MEGAAQSEKDRRGPRGSRSFSGDFFTFTGMSKTSLKGLGEGEEEESDGTEVVSAPVGASEGIGGPTLSHFHQSEPSLLAIMQQMTQIMANIETASRPPDCFDGTKPFKVRSFIQSFRLIFQNEKKNFSQDKKKVLDYNSVCTCRAPKWIETYISNFTNQDSTYLFNSWELFKSQLLMLFGDPNEVRKAEEELDSLRIKKGGHVFLYIAYFKSFVLRIGDWGERVYMPHFMKGFSSRILDQLASHPSIIDSLQDLMNVTLEIDNRYHERQKEKNNSKGKKTEASKSSSSNPQNSSSSRHKEKKNSNFQKRDMKHSFFLNKY